MTVADTVIIGFSMSCLLWISLSSFEATVGCCPCDVTSTTIIQHMWRHLYNKHTTHVTSLLQQTENTCDVTSTTNIQHMRHHFYNKHTTHVTSLLRQTYNTCCMWRHFYNKHTTHVTSLLQQTDNTCDVTSTTNRQRSRPLINNIIISVLSFIWKFTVSVFPVGTY